MQSIPERDWKVFTRLQPVAHERFCERALEEVEKIVADASKDCCDRFFRIATILRDRDRELRNDLSDYRRSTAWLQMAAMYRRGLLTEEELAQFSEDTRDFVKRSSTIP